MNLIPVVRGLPTVRGVSRKIIVVDVDSTRVITNCSGVVYNMDTIVINRTTHFEVDRVYCFLYEGGVVRPAPFGSKVPRYHAILRRDISCCADYGFLLTSDFLNCRSRIEVCGVLDPEDRGLSFASGDVIRMFMQPEFRSVAPASFAPVEYDAAMVDATTEIETDLQTLRNNSVGVNRLLGADKWNRLLQESETNRTVRNALAESVGGRRSQARKATSLFTQVLLTHRATYHYPPAGHLVGGVLYYVRGLPHRRTMMANVAGFMWYDLLGFAPLRSQKNSRIVNPLIPSGAVSVHRCYEYFVTTRWLFDNLFPAYSLSSYQKLSDMVPNYQRELLHEVLRMVLNVWFHTHSGVCPIHNLSPGEMCTLAFMFYRVNGYAPDVDGCGRERVRCLSSWLVVPCEELCWLFSYVLRQAGYRVMGSDDLPYDANVSSLASSVLEGSIEPSYLTERALDLAEFERLRPGIDLVISPLRPPSSLAGSWRATLLPVGHECPRYWLPASRLGSVASMTDGGDTKSMLDILTSFGPVAYRSVSIGFLGVPFNAFHFTQSICASSWYYTECFGMIARLCAHLRYNDISSVRLCRNAPTSSIPQSRAHAPLLPVTLTDVPRRCVICFDSCMVQFESRPCMRFDSHFVCPSCVHVRCPIPGCNGAPLSGKFMYPSKRFPGDENTIVYFPDGPETVELLTHEFKDCTEDTAWRSLCIIPRDEPTLRIMLPYVRNYISGYDDAALDSVSSVSYAHAYASLIERDLSNI